MAMTQGRVDPKAIADGITSEELEADFRPHSMGDLMARLFGPEEFLAILMEANADESPGGMPHRFRGPYVSYGLDVLRREHLYRTIKHELENAPSES